ncbi:DUF3817 domain-containing protein [Planococcus lenghuensis]|uniref:DUF3817 domain-containing protein n=1 Tax=Planococcus lenghuensis TaxID=2213202 RepID=A0A1Q2KYE2_9BACL|nr:DUF3817 domain-containing protein [Planococcus lenghuensis]AQQ53124.1 hypothetical protein B0X71_08465 [Planococcus lenghuensis]
MLKSKLGKFRFLGYLEGGSLLFLLFIAMPLKYWAGMPEVVTVVGALHGALFTVYCLGILYMTIAVRWPFIYSVLSFIVAFIPFGNFVLDRQLKKLEASDSPIAQKNVANTVSN